ncbi:hypothetical protein DO659_03310 [Salmonella enterica subsp. enterica serovar Minnesota]|nr:hypothetical protein [Salmonella enterica subsp. enterica serovar Minnesota]ECI4646677.1 hypothetical protein [Salmonella enterica subsp. salamae]
MAKNTDNTADIDVVVCKGRTVYHNGEKYGENRKLKLSPADVEPLQSRGFVVPMAELMAAWSDRPGDGASSTEGGDGG